MAQRRRAELENIDGAAVAGSIDHAALIDAACFWKQAHQRQIESRFAAAAFADEGQRFACVQVEGHISYGAYTTTPRRVAHVEIADFENDFITACACHTPLRRRGLKISSSERVNSTRHN